MRIILFGGAFNPVHNEHVAILKAAQTALNADKTIIMPTAVSPHKRGRIAASPASRLEMCRLAFGKTCEVSDFEIKKGGASYSYITCEHLKRMYPGDEIYFLMGADMLACFHEWVYPERILRCVKLAVCEREGEADLGRVCAEMKKGFGADVFKVGYAGAALSSTRIRVAAAIGYDVSDCVPQGVAEYISDQKIYSIPVLKAAQKLLKKGRAMHTLRVAYMAAENCERIKIDERAAVIAAALHDCGKYVKPGDKILRGFTPPENVPDSVMHQYTGAYIAEHVFGIDDEDILNAVRYHTSGRPGMSRLEKLIYLSDMLEEERDFPEIEKLRKAFKEDIDLCLELSLRHVLDFLENEGEPVFALTREAYEYIRAVREKKCI